MKVLFLNTLYAPNFLGGAERIVQSLAEGMAEAGHRVVVVSTVPRKETRIGWLNGVKIYYIGQRNFYYWPPRGKGSPKALKPFWHGLDTYNPWMAREVDRILEAERPDLVHTNVLAGFSALAWEPAKRRGLPLVQTLHDYYLLCPRATMFRNGKNCERRCLECRLYALPRGRLSNLADVVVGDSRFVLERHLEFGYFAATPEKRVIHNAYRAGPTIPAPGGQRLPIRFGYLGRLHPTKGLEVLLDSAKQLPKGTWRLDVAGRGLAEYERDLHTRHKDPAIEFLGHVKPEVLFSEIDVLVVPSVWNEPFGRVVVEAYAHGVPVIGSNRGGIPELIEEGRIGFLFDPGRPDELTAKMRRFIDERASISEMRAACLRKAESFLPENVVEQYLQAYASAMRSA